MNESHVMGCIASAMQFIVAGYALRLNRRFGTARVGWSLFGAFSSLALLQLIQSTGSFSATMDATLKINVIYALISFLLLIGLVHMESMLKEHSRMERVEKQLRADLEMEVKSKTEHLTRAIDELMHEIEKTERMSAIIESTEETTRTLTADGFSESDSFTVPIKPEPPATKRDNDCEQLLAGIMGPELISQF